MSGAAILAFCGDRAVPTISFTSTTVDDSGENVAAAGYQVNGSTGYIQTLELWGTGVFENFETFVSPVSRGIQCEVSATLQTGSISGSAFDTYHDLAVTTPSWTATSAASTNNASMTVTIREKADTSNTMTRTVYLNAVSV